MMIDHPECGAKPWTIDFGVPNQFNFDLRDPAVNREQCELKNPGDECKIQACQVEMSFIDYVVESIFVTIPGGQASQIDTGLSHNNFDFQGTCKAAIAANQQGAAGSTDVQCCGESPNRFPYNALFKQCNADGTVTGIGF